MGARHDHAESLCPDAIQLMSLPVRFDPIPLSSNSVAVSRRLIGFALPGSHGAGSINGFLSEFGCQASPTRQSDVSDLDHETIAGREQFPFFSFAKDLAGLEASKRPS